MRATHRAALTLVRPPFAVLVAMVMSLGLLQGSPRPSLLTQVLTCIAVSGWMLCSVALNDLADVDIDKVNLPEDPGRLHAAGVVGREELVVLAAAAAACAMAAAAALGTFAGVVVLLGLALAAAYSLPPFRLCSRGVLTSLILPLAYIAVPFLVGASTWAPGLPARSWTLLAGLYVGFVGRLALKDFRDQRGDRLFGKRTLLVRHGRARTCVFAATFMTGGTALTVAALPEASRWTWLAGAGAVVAGLALLWSVGRDAHGMRDRANIAAFAMVGRWFVLLAVAQAWASAVGWSSTSSAALVAVTAAAGAGFAVRIRRLTLPRRSGTRDQLDLLAAPSSLTWARSSALGR